MLLFEPPSICLAQTGLVRADALRASGGFDPHLSTSADWDLSVRLAARYKIRSVPEPLAFYRLHENQMHLDVGVMQRDMELAFAKTFGTNLLPYSYRQLERAAYARLRTVLAGSYLASGQRRRAAGQLARAFAGDPVFAAKRCVRRVRLRRSGPVSGRVGDAPRGP
jgi:hypothetical protein